MPAGMPLACRPLLLLPHSAALVLAQLAHLPCEVGPAGGCSSCPAGPLEHHSLSLALPKSLLSAPVAASCVAGRPVSAGWASHRRGEGGSYQPHNQKKTKQPG